VKNNFAAAWILVPTAAILSACTPKLATDAPRPVRTLEVRYDNARETNRYVGTVQARHQVDQGFRVGGKVAKRLVEVGQTVGEGDVLAVLDDADYRLAEEAAQQQHTAAITQATQAESDRKRLEALKSDGSVSASDSEHAQSSARAAHAAAEAEARKLDLAGNRLKYTVLRASQSGVVTSVKFEVGQVVAEGQPVVSIANQGEPEIVVDVPEDNVQSFRGAKFKATLASNSDELFDVALRELSPQAAAQTRTYRARLKPVDARRLPLGATATLVAEKSSGNAPVAVIPASALTQIAGQPALWIVRRTGTQPVGTADLTPVTVEGYRNDDVLITGPQAGALVVVAGVQKMAPGVNVALQDAAPAPQVKQAAK
jgi:membrane fusion protein, multidrug efflux system